MELTKRTQLCAKCSRSAGQSGFCYIHARASKNTFYSTFKRLQAIRAAAKEHK